MRKLLAILLALVTVFTLCACKEAPRDTWADEEEEEKKEKPKAVYQGNAYKGYVTESGAVQIITPTNDLITVRPSEDNYRVVAAWLTPNGEHIVLAQYDGYSEQPKLAVTDIDQTEYKVLGDVAHVLAVRNEGVLYQNVGYVERYFFGDEKSEVTYVTNFVDVVVASHSLSCAFKFDNTVCVWPYDAVTPTEVGDFRKATLQTVSSDGESLFWTGEGNALFLYRDEKVVTIANYSTATYGMETYDSKLQVVCDYDSGKFYVLRPGKEMETVSEGSSGRWHTFYTTAGHLSQSTAKDASTMYAVHDQTLYAIDKNNKTKKIADNILNFILYGDRLVYLETGGRLFFATLENNEITDPVQVAVDVVSFQTADNKTVYYLRNNALEKADFDSRNTQYLTYSVTDYYINGQGDLFVYSQRNWDKADCWDICYGSYERIERVNTENVSDIYFWSWIIS